VSGNTHLSLSLPHTHTHTHTCIQLTSVHAYTLLSHHTHTSSHISHLDSWAPARLHMVINHGSRHIIVLDHRARLEKPEGRFISVGSAPRPAVSRFQYLARLLWLLLTCETGAGGVFQLVLRSTPSAQGGLARVSARPCNSCYIQLPTSSHRGPKPCSIVCLLVGPPLWLRVYAVGAHVHNCRTPS
jgi:hypothetical protein